MALTKEEQTLTAILTKAKVTFNAPKMFKIGDQGRKIYFTALIPNIAIDKSKEAPKSLLIHIQEKLADKREETVRDNNLIIKEAYSYAKENNYCVLGLHYTDNAARMSEAVSDMLQLIHKGEEKGIITRVSSHQLATLIGLDNNCVLETKQQQQPKKTVTIVDNKGICLETDPVPPLSLILQIPDTPTTQPPPIPVTSTDAPTTTTKSGFCIIS